MKKTLYELLEVRNNDSPETIATAYHRMREYYTELEKTDPAAGEQLKVLKLAYEVILDPIQRVMYDQRLRLSQMSAVQPVGAPIASDSDFAPGSEAEADEENGERTFSRRFLGRPLFAICAVILLAIVVFLVIRTAKPVATPQAVVNPAAAKSPLGN
ncbi:MAG: DnaJ domain-containing protein [Betaproteobacteria bacterium]